MALLPAVFGAAILTSISPLFGNKTNVFLLYFEINIPFLSQPTFGLGRIIAAMFSFTSILYGSSASVLAALGAVIHAEIFNFWTAELSKMPKHLTTKEIWNAFIQFKLFTLIAERSLVNQIVFLSIVACFILNVICNYIIIDLYSKMSMFTYLLIVILFLGLNLLGYFLYPKTAEMNVHSSEFKHNISVSRNKWLRLMGISFQPLRIRAGNFFSLKMDTWFQFLSYVYDSTITLLVTFRKMNI